MAGRAKILTGDKIDSDHSESDQGVSHCLKCFICSEDVTNENYLKIPFPKQGAIVLCHILEIPLLENLARFVQFNYCHHCRRILREIHSSLDLLARIEKTVLDMKEELRDLMEETCSERRRAPWPDNVEDSSVREFRDLIMTGLTSKYLLSSLSKVSDHRFGKEFYGAPTYTIPVQTELCSPDGVPEPGNSKCTPNPAVSMNEIPKSTEPAKEAVKKGSEMKINTEKDEPPKPLGPPVKNKRGRDTFGIVRPDSNQDHTPKPCASTSNHVISMNEIPEDTEPQKQAVKNGPEMKTTTEKDEPPRSLGRPGNKKSGSDTFSPVRPDSNQNPATMKLDKKLNIFRKQPRAKAKLLSNEEEEQERKLMAGDEQPSLEEEPGLCDTKVTAKSRNKSEKKISAVKPSLEEKPEESDTKDTKNSKNEKSEKIIPVIQPKEKKEQKWIKERTFLTAEAAEEAVQLGGFWRLDREKINNARKKAYYSFAWTAYRKGQCDAIFYLRYDSTSPEVVLFRAKKVAKIKITTEKDEPLGRPANNKSDSDIFSIVRPDSKVSFSSEAKSTRRKRKISSETSSVNLERRKKMKILTSVGTSDESALEEDFEMPCYETEQSDCDYVALTNSEVQGGSVVLSKGILKKHIILSEPYRDLKYCMDYPGVLLSFDKRSDEVSVGYITLNHRTIRPFETAERLGTIIIQVMKGKRICVKSFRYDIGKKPTLHLQTIPLGGYIVVPTGVPFSLENWSDIPATLFCVVQRQ